MTANELLVMLGRAWSRLLIYPGGLAAFGTIWLAGGLFQRFSHNTAALRHSLSPAPHRSPILSGSALVLPWLLLALLPLPLAVALPRQLDIVVALALLEWPNLLAIRQELRAGGRRRLAAALNSYPPLILAILVLSQAGNSLELAALARPPGDAASTSTLMLHWLGVIALALALPPALGLGSFAVRRQPTTDGDEAFPQFSGSPTPNPQHPTPVMIGLRLRALGLVTLAALPWAGAEGTGLALLRLLGAAALIAALLWGFDRLTWGQAARRWAWAYLAFDGVLLLALLGAAYLALQLRLA